MIGGQDVTFEVHALRSSSANILYACLKHWPRSLYQNAESSEAYPVYETMLTEELSHLVPEFFIYRDRQSYEKWTKEGASEDNVDTMIHFLLTDKETTEKPVFQVTMVSDTRSGEIQEIENTVKRFVSDPFAMIPILGGMPGPPHPAEIDVHHAVLESYVLFFPRLHVTQLLFNPRLAIQLCDLVRMRVSMPIPDSLILQTLFIKYQEITQEK